VTFYFNAAKTDEWALLAAEDLGIAATKSQPQHTSSCTVSVLVNSTHAASVELLKQNKTKLKITNNTSYL